MTIFVDNVFIEARVNRITSKWCHLFSDDTDPQELHDFARQIGMRRAWFQHKPEHPEHDHYDVTLNMRARAVMLGAVEIDFRDAAEYWFAKAELLRNGSGGRATPSPLPHDYRDAGRADS